MPLAMPNSPAVASMFTSGVAVGSAVRMFTAPPIAASPKRMVHRDVLQFRDKAGVFPTVGYEW